MLPLSFNFRLHGSLDASSQFGDKNSQSHATVGYTASLTSLDGGRDSTSGQIQRSSIAGVPSLQRWSDASGFELSGGPIIDEKVSVTLPVSTGGRLSSSLTATALASVSGGASADVDFLSTFALESITLPSNYNRNGLGNLEVAFGSGKRYVVTQADVTPVPEPSSLLLLVTGLVALYRLLICCNLRQGC
ncbi:PEP-CTERM sorting domain-containing protein [Maioricimonas rarisocia]